MKKHINTERIVGMGTAIKKMLSIKKVQSTKADFFSKVKQK
ncbi:hypothetical protein SPHINGO8BC_150205 [Sphingobacterium multivorum]|uniref:Uncharacterized protein n=1 Tax=Sphingobacterium multivorum TaxID=28454 RepID=A0A654A3T3_SPHMU|nr:hypothetical protein SPHINGO8BC_150205 [Sphingobacterium multivorum]